MAFWSALCLALCSLGQASNPGALLSSIVATSSTARTCGLSPSPASCTLAPWVRVWALHGPVVTFGANFVDIAMGIVLVYQNAEVDGGVWSGLPYYSISISLDILLTLMIITRLILHTRNVRTALGLRGVGGLSKAIITMLIESCALYAVSSLLVLGPLSVRNDASVIFVPILSETQVGAFGPRSSDRLFNVTMHLTGYCPTTCH